MRIHPVPATTNPLGVKGVGEAATTGAIATVMIAIANAIPGDAGARLDDAGDAGEGVAGLPRNQRLIATKRPAARPLRTRAPRRSCLP